MTFQDQHLLQSAILGRTTNTNDASAVPLNSPLIPLLCDVDGVLLTRVIAGAAGSGVSLETEVIGSDGETVPGTAQSLMVSGAQLGFNETSYDRWRNNTEETILASAARTASVDSADFTNFNARGAHFIINVTAVTATPSIVVTIQGMDALSGVYYDILVGDPITTTGITVLKVYPNGTAIAGGAATDILPRMYRVSVTNADADSITYSVGASLVV